MLRKLALVIHALNTGGAERVMASMANHWAEQDVDVTLITLDTRDTDRFPLHHNVHRVSLDLMRESKYPWQAVRNNLARIRRLRGAIRDTGAERVVSFTDKMNVLTLLASVGQRWKVIITERSDPRWQKMSRGWELLRRFTYPRCSALVVQTESVAEYARRLVRKRPVYVIPNAVMPPAGQAALGEPERSDHRVVAAMGRLSVEKGFDLLIEAFAKIADKQPDWDLRIAGDGVERRRLEHTIESRGLTERVELCGWVDQPHAFLRDASFFVLPSRYEGFPNVLLEAMACGLPVVSFDCDSGPREIVRHETDGLLVPPEDVEALAQALDRLMSRSAECARLSQNATEVTTRFGCEVFFERWERICADITKTCK